MVLLQIYLCFNNNNNSLKMKIKFSKKSKINSIFIDTKKSVRL